MTAYVDNTSSDLVLFYKGKYNFFSFVSKTNKQKLPRLICQQCFFAKKKRAWARSAPEWRDSTSAASLPTAWAPFSIFQIYSQAYNGILQSLPSVLFTMYAGPLSDRYGRKPLILVSFVGYFILNVFSCMSNE